MSYTFGSLFSGIGGIDLGLSWAGWTCAFQIEIDPYCRKILKRHWPSVPRHDDIKTFESSRYVDLLAAGFPCQPFSVLGKQRSEDDERFLWPDVTRLAGTIRPRFLLIENVSNWVKIRGGATFRSCLSDLSRLGYDAVWRTVSASDAGLPHRRDRTFLVAIANTAGIRVERLWQTWDEELRTLGREMLSDRPGNRLREVEPDLVRSLHGLPPALVRSRKRVSRHRIKALGNAVVPALATVVGKVLIKVTQHQEY